MADFFISYRGTDLSWAQWIAWELKQAGFEVIYQAASFRDGLPLVDQINTALASTQCTIAVISPAYFESPWCKIEWQTAYTLDAAGEGHRLLLIKIKPSVLPPLLRARTWVELIGMDEGAARSRLLQAVKPMEQPSATKPPFPVSRPPLPVSPGPVGGNLVDAFLQRIREMFSPMRTLVNPVAEYRQVSPAAAIPGLAKITAPKQFPGRPEIWNVPHAFNPNFVGRDGLLEELRKALVSGRPAAVTQAVTGLGGVGKTQLATMYAYLYSGDYDLVWWVNSESSATLAAEYSSLAKPLGLPEQDAQNLGEQAQAVRRALEARQKWLLIFDNVKQPDDLNGYLPQHASGHVIITSRDPNWRQVAQPLVVPTLARADSIELLQRRSGKQDPDAAGKLAGLLGDLPVALVQAAAYMERTNKPLAEYLELFRQHRKKLWEHEQPPDGYQKTVAETLTLNLQQVQEHSPAAGDLLRLCAYLAPDKIPLDILCQHAAELPPELAAVLADPIELDAALAELRSYSLIEVSAGTLSLHRLVQAVVRDRLSVDAQQTWCAAAVQVINAAFPGDTLTNLASWPICDCLTDHAQAVTEHAEQLSAAPAQAGRLAACAGVYLQQRAQFREAETLMRRALAIGEQSYGAEHPNVATALNNLATLLQATNRLAEAEPLMRHVVDILENPGGEPYPNYAGALNNLAQWLKATNRLAEAEPLMRRALAIDTQSYGAEHPEVATDLNNLAMLLQATNRQAEAEPLMRRGLAIEEQSKGAEHPHVAIQLNNLAALLQATNRLTEAEPLMRRALTIDTQSYGAEHPDVAIDLNNLVTLLYATNRLAEAEPLMRRMLMIFIAFKTNTGHEHPNWRDAIGNYSGLLKAMGKTDAEIESVIASLREADR